MKNHAKIFFKGLSRTLYGAATAGLYGLAIAGFTTIPKEGGYSAVCEFVLAVLTLAVALGCTYAQGSRKGGGKKNKRFYL